MLEVYKLVSTFKTYVVSFMTNFIIYNALLRQNAVNVKCDMRSESALLSVAGVTEIVKSSPSGQW